MNGGNETFFTKGCFNFMTISVSNCGSWILKNSLDPCVVGLVSCLSISLYDIRNMISIGLCVLYFRFTCRSLVNGYCFPNLLGQARVLKRHMINNMRSVNTLRPRQNGRRDFADDIFKCIFLNENVRLSIKISLKFIH